MASSDQLFVEILREAIFSYLRAVDQWEATYNAYYRMPGYGQTISPDMEAHQREFEARRRLLEPLLPRARQLCLKYGLGNPFPGLLHTSLGQHAPQQRIESAISRNERNAVILCLEQLTDACQGLAPPAKPEKVAQVVRPPEPHVSRFSRSWAVLAIVLCGLLLWQYAPKWPFTGIRLSTPPSTSESSYGKRSGSEIDASWLAERRRESARFTDADLQRMVERLFVQDDPGRTNFHGLLYAGARPLPYLRRALEDPRTATMVFSKTSVDELGISPFGRICSLLDELAPAEVVPQLTRYLRHPDPSFRRLAASLVARIGTPQCVDPVKKALADDDRDVREFTLIGLMHGLKAQRRNAEFLSGVFPAVVPLLNAGMYDVGSPAAVMMDADPIQAAPILELPRYFSVRNPQLREILRALDRQDVKVPHEVLLPLLAKLEPLATKESPEEFTYTAALVLYARNPDDEAESRFQTLIHSPSTTVATTGARGLEILAGVSAHDAVWDAYGKRGFNAMTKPQQLYFAVELYRDEVDNGGHNQYFYNDDSDLYQVAVEGLKAIGATSKAAILSDAARAFAGSPGPTERERRDQMERFGPAQSRIFELADRRFYQSEEVPGERLGVLLTLYALQHKSDFLEKRQAKKTDDLSH